MFKITHIKNSLALFVLLFWALGASAQNNAIEMADSLRADGKIYVVVAVMAIILVGFLIYLFSIDRKLKKIEKNYLDRK